jgi:hypothetical protein
MYIRWLPVIGCLGAGYWQSSVACLLGSSVQFSSVQFSNDYWQLGLVWSLQAVYRLLRCFVDVSTSYFYIYILNEFVSISHIPAALATRGRPERPGSANFAGPARKT